MSEFSYADKHAEQYDVYTVDVYTVYPLLLIKRFETKFASNFPGAFLFCCGICNCFSGKLCFLSNITDNIYIYCKSPYCMRRNGFQILRIAFYEPFWIF